MLSFMPTMVHSLNAMSIVHGAICPVEAFPGTHFTAFDKAIAGLPIANDGQSLEYAGSKGDLEWKRDAMGYLDTRQYYGCMDRTCDGGWKKYSNKKVD